MCASRRSPRQPLRRGRKRRAKTDNSDCDLMLTSSRGELPRPDPARADPRVRSRVRCARRDRPAHGLVAAAAGAAVHQASRRLKPRTAADAGACERRVSPADARPSSLPADAHQLDRELAPIDRTLRPRRRQPAAAHYRQLYRRRGHATAILAELRCAPLRSSDDAAPQRLTYRSADRKRAAGHLSHQPSAALALSAAQAPPPLSPTTPTTSVAKQSPHRACLSSRANSAGAPPHLRTPKTHSPPTSRAKLAAAA